jgi:hypothetical protein
MSAKEQKMMGISGESLEENTGNQQIGLFPASNIYLLNDSRGRR